MSEPVLLWILGGFLTAFLALAAALWRHVTQCRSSNAMIAEIGGDVKRLQQDIGTHDTGIRGTVHKTANAVIVLQEQIRELRQETQR